MDIEVLWRQWWRVGGAFGIGFVVLFIIGPIILAGSTPHRDDSIEEIRQYFTDDGDIYLAGDYIAGIAFLLFFLPYVVTLRWLLGSGEGWPPIWSWLTVVGGLTGAVLGGAGSVFWGALAVGAATNPEVEDSSVRTLMELDTYARSVLVWLPGALFVGAASIVVWRTGVTLALARDSWLARLPFAAVRRSLDDRRGRRRILRYLWPNRVHRHSAVDPDILDRHAAADGGTGADGTSGRELVARRRGLTSRQAQASDRRYASHHLAGAAGDGLRDAELVVALHTAL